MKENTGALLSDCGKYRYKLWRVWDDSKPLVMFIMLNPSIASENINDPTIRKCIKFAKSWGYGGIMVGNLIPLITPYPIELKQINWQSEEYLKANDLNAQAVNEMSFKCAITILAWGNINYPVNTAGHWSKGNAHYLHINKSGEPKHPLYIKDNQKPIKVIHKAIFG